MSQWYTETMPKVTLSIYGKGCLSLGIDTYSQVSKTDPGAVRSLCVWGGVGGREHPWALWGLAAVGSA